MAKSFRTYPSISLDEAENKLSQVYEQVGRGPSSKEAYVKGLGYKSISGASSTVFAALIHYGFIEKSGQDYKISELGMHILHPDDETDESKIAYLRQAALRPSLFRDIYDRYEGERLPVLLHNTLIHDFRVHDKSGKDAADKFKSTLESARLLKDDHVISRTGIVTEPIEPVNQSNSSEILKRPTYPESSLLSSQSEELNRIEIILREGVKAGIYAPFNLSEPEKEKLKAIIDLL